MKGLITLTLRHPRSGRPSAPSTATQPNGARGASMRWKRVRGMHHVAPRYDASSISHQGFTPLLSQDASVHQRRLYVTTNASLCYHRSLPADLIVTGGGQRLLDFHNTKQNGEGTFRSPYMPGCGVKSHVALVVGLCVVTESCGSRGTTCAACDVREVTSSSALKHVLRFYFTGARPRRGDTCSKLT